MKQASFPQIVAACVCGISLLILAAVLFVPSKGSHQDMIVGCLIGSFTSSLGFFIGTTIGSKAKDEANQDNTNKLIDSLANSTPVTKNI